MSQSDMIPAVISLLSSDDDAGPSKRQDSSSKDKPKKKISRKKRAPGTKTKNVGFKFLNRKYGFLGKKPFLHICCWKNRPKSGAIEA